MNVCLCVRAIIWCDISCFTMTYPALASFPSPIPLGSCVDFQMDFICNRQSLMFVFFSLCHPNLSESYRGFVRREVVFGIWLFGHAFCCSVSWPTARQQASQPASQPGTRTFVFNFQLPPASSTTTTTIAAP